MALTWPGKSVLDFDDPDPSPKAPKPESKTGYVCTHRCNPGGGTTRHANGFTHVKRPPQPMRNHRREKPSKTSPAAIRCAAILQDLGLMTADPDGIEKAWKYDPARRREIRDFVSRQAPSGLPLVYSGPTHDKSKRPGKLEIRSLAPHLWDAKGRPVKLKAGA